MSHTHVIKKKDLPPDQVEPVSVDETTLSGQQPRIPRDRVQVDPQRPSHLDPEQTAAGRHGVIRRDRVTVTPGSVATVDDEDAPPPSDTPPPADAPPNDDAAQEAPDPMEELRAELEAEWNARLEAAREDAREAGYEAGHEAGYEAGYEAAREELQADFDATLRRLADDVEQLRSLWHEYIEATEPALLDMTVEIAEAVLDAPLPESIRGASARAIAEAVEDLANADSLTVSLHPVDYQRLQEQGLIDQLTANHEQTLHWHPDPDHEEGDWSVESPTALIRHWKDETLSAIKQRLGTRSAPPEPPPAADDGNAAP